MNDKPPIQSDIMYSFADLSNLWHLIRCLFDHFSIYYTSVLFLRVFCFSTQFYLPSDRQSWTKFKLINSSVCFADFSFIAVIRWYRKTQGMSACAAYPPKPHKMHVSFWLWYSRSCQVFRMLNDDHFSCSTRRAFTVGPGAAALTSAKMSWLHARSP